MSLEEHKYLPYYLAILLMAGLLTVAAFSPPEETKNREPKAELGDMVSVIYVGKFTDGRVFDTNDPSVNSWDDVYPKAASYQTKPTDQIQPLQFTLGSGQLLADFENAVIGMKTGDKKTITILAEHGYGLDDENLTFEVDLIQEMPVFERMSLDDFNDTYGYTYDRSQDAPPMNLSFRHFAYGWNVTVIAIDGDWHIRLMNIPVIGPVNTFPWTADIINITSGGNGTILVEHHPEIWDMLSREYQPTDPWRPDDPAATEGRVIDLDSKTFTLDYNREVVGEILVFDIELIIIH